MEDLLPRLMEHVRSQPWALMPEKMALMVDLLRFRNAGGRLTREEIAARIGSPERNRYDLVCHSLEWNGAVVGFPLAQVTQGRPTDSVIAVLGVLGIISHRASMVDDISGPGGTSIERLAANFRAALGDPAVRAIVLDVDSPGGGVYGVQELASEILASRGGKPVVALANSLAASAAYWIASAADEVSVTPSGEVGSIGVYGAHEDISGALEKEGIKVTLISDPAGKIEGNPFEPLDAEARAYMQSRITEYKDAFVGTVAKARGVPRAKVERDFGQGRIVGAKAALEAGMVDRIETLGQAIRRLAGKRGSAPPAAASAIGAGEPVTLHGGEAVAARSYAAENEADASRARVRVATQR